MHQRHDLRHELSMVRTQAQALWSSLLLLPADEATMQEALDVMTPTERQQAAEHLGDVARRCYQISERARWLKSQLQQGLGPGGV